MTWQILNTEPTFGICDICKSHTCGVLPDGLHQWVLTPLEDRYGDRQVIGYGCVKAFAENMGIAKEIVQVEVVRDPTHEEIGQRVTELLNELMEKKYVKVVDGDVSHDSDNHPFSDEPDSDTTNPPADLGQQASQSTRTRQKRRK